MQRCPHLHESFSDLALGIGDRPANEPVTSRVERVVDLACAEVDQLVRLKPAEGGLGLPHPHRGLGGVVKRAGLVAVGRELRHQRDVLGIGHRVGREADLPLDSAARLLLL